MRLPVDARPLLEVKGLNFFFESLHVLSDVNFNINASEVHAIVGEHGAGKSSLCMILGGFLKPHTGYINFEGTAYSSLSPKKARNLGIEIVTQNNPLIENINVESNIFFDNQGIAQHPFINLKKHREKARAFLQALDFDLNLDKKLMNMNLSDHVLVDVLKRIQKKPRLLILDEALEKLTAPNLRKIITILNDMKSAGTAILYITHRVDDIYNFADRVSIIKNGEILITDSVKNINKINLIKLAYTQIVDNSNIRGMNQEFYHLLKYNEAVLKKLPVNLLVVDSVNRLKLINESAKRYFGVKEEDYLNTPIQDLFIEENPKVYSLLRSSLAYAEEKAFYHVPLTRNQEEAITNIKLYPIYDETFLIGHYIMIEDITEQESLRQQVLFSEKLASVGLLAAGVAHEINNPLEIIYNNLRTIKFNGDPVSVKRSIDSIEEETNAITQIVGNLITFTDNRRLSTKSTEMNELIETIISLVRYHAENKGIEINYRKSAESIFIAANRTEIKQVILNLIKNSFEAMPNGGKLDIETNYIEENEKKSAEIIISDTGCGIKNKNMNDVFLPFFTTKEEGNNLGLGLSVSYGIIKKYNGSINIFNRPKGGSIFCIQLPCSLESKEP